MKTVLLLRHGKSSWKDSSLTDYDRPLKKRGRHDAARVGELLIREQLVPDLILTSSAQRTQQTVDLLIEACNFRGEVASTRELYDASARHIAKVVAATPPTVQRVLVVGHNPVLEELLEAWTGVDATLVTAALAQVNFTTDDWSALQAGSGSLAAQWAPRDLPD